MIDEDMIECISKYLSELIEMTIKYFDFTEEEIKMLLNGDFRL